jgi:large subunit ribosomal protein L5
MSDDKKSGPPKGKPDEAEIAKKRAERAAKKSGKSGGGAESSVAAAEQGEKPGPARLRLQFKETIGPALMKELGLKSAMELPRLQKITINMGLGEAVSNPKILDTAVEELRAIAGQQPVVTKAKKSIATYKLREGQKIGAMVTLRRERMWEFLDRLVTLALPRVRDIKGVSAKGFDGRGNYSLGIKEQIIFPEINFDRVEKIKGMNISIVTTAKTDDHGRALLKALGMPFRQHGAQA